MRFSRLVLIVAAALPLGACFMTAEEVAADNARRDYAACRHDGLKPATPAYAKCREDIKSRRGMADMAAQIGRQNDIWAMQSMNRATMMH